MWTKVRLDKRGLNGIKWDEPRKWAKLRLDKRSQNDIWWDKASWGEIR